MTPLIVGSLEDPHVRAVRDAASERPAVLDVQMLSQLDFQFSPPNVKISGPDWTLVVEQGTPGWLRRLSPMAWEAGTTIGSHEAVVKASWLSLLAALLRHPDVRWLTAVDAMTAAENKLTQYTTAARLGIPVPKTFVTNSRAAFESAAGEFIAKPLGPGHFRDQGGDWLTVFTERFDPLDPEDLGLLDGPPFLVQQRVRPEAHLRVTTVQDRAWVFRLPAEGLPIDWRRDEHAHDSWTRVVDDGIASRAVQLANAHGLGYSSQDWLEVDGSHLFLDLNPGGQWLFLPRPGSDEITASISDWLIGS